MGLIDEAMQNSKCIISVIGSHAGEGINNILDRKKADIQKIGKTFWIVKSSTISPSEVQGICNATPIYTLFIGPASKGGAKDTKNETVAKSYSEDYRIWHPLPEHLTPVTGKLDSQTTALVFDRIETGFDEMINLWDYSEQDDQPLKLSLGRSTTHAIQKDPKNHPDRMKSPHRKLIAIARLVKPYAVWVDSKLKFGVD
ncbi:MAG: hypothetical protein IPK09_02830 [Candidatus Competibacteraceae bacterium]|nr:hypothetical protein [Candidatus Competibacteraceae bacterium]